MMFAQKTTYRRWIIGLVAIAVFAQSALAPLAHASTVSVISDTSTTNIKTSVESTISSAADVIQSNASVTILNKEIFLDKIAFMLAKATLRQITASIVQWINSGFQGSPAFVTDLEGFLLDVADQEAGRFIYGSELGFLCSPFQLDVRIALALQYQGARDYEVQCTLSDVVDNVDGFLAGNFEDGGWQGWFAITGDPSNSPTGAFLEAEAELSARIVDAQGREIKKLDFGDGFFSTEFCETIGGTLEKQNCTITTPGNVIAESINNHLSYGEIALIEADEINEIIGALFAQLAQQAITGAGGLLGVSRGGYGGVSDQTYLDALQNENIDFSSNGGLDESSILRQALDDETEYQELHITLLEDLQAVETLRSQTALKWQGLLPGCFSVQQPDTFLEYVNAATSSAIASAGAIALLEDLTDEFTATTSPAAQLELFSDFERLQRTNVLHDQVDIAVVETDLIRRATDDINQLRFDIREADQQCEQALIAP